MLNINTQDTSGINVSAKVEELIHQLIRNYPAYPSTFSTCNCGINLARGNGKCADCIEGELSLFIGKPLAWELHQNIKQFASLKGEALDIASEQS